MTVPTRVAILGFGNMGRTHWAAYDAARRAGIDCEVAAVFDRHPERALQTLGLQVGYVTSELDRILEDRAIQAVSVCTHTDSHVDLAQRALEAGKHVLVEKPISLDIREIERLQLAQRAARLVCMPAHCMRFWPEWRRLYDVVRARTYGDVQTATFQRLCAKPVWARHFYEDTARSGGALWDLHWHDVDFIRWCFGEPLEVSARGTLSHVTSVFRFVGRSPAVTTEASWELPPGSAFCMRFAVHFDAGRLEFDLGHQPALRLEHRGVRAPLCTDTGSAYDLMVMEFLRSLRNDQLEACVTLEDALRAARYIHGEQLSLREEHP